MKKRIFVVASLLLTLAFVFSVESVHLGGKSLEPSNAKLDTCALGEGLDGDIINEVSNRIGDATGIGGAIESIAGGLEDATLDVDISGVAGSLGDKVKGAIGDLGDGIGNIGSIFGNLGGGSSNSVTYDVNTIAPVVTKATEAQTEANNNVNTEADTEATVTESTTYGLTVAEGTDVNPYSKPTEAINPGDEGDAVRWVQWALIYSGYGLRPDGITGVMDDETVAYVKKIQQENGLKVTGIVDDETADKIELLYFEKKLEGNTGQFIEPSATVAETVAVDNGNGNKTFTVVAVILAVLWVLVIAAVVVFFILKRKKTAKDIEKYDAEQKAQGENTASSEDMGSLKDLFEEAEKKKKKRRRKR